MAAVPTPTGLNAEDVKVGPFQLPLPWLIPICIFSPFFLSFSIFVVYRYTIVRHRRNNQTVLGEGEEVEPQKLDADTEKQVQDFLRKPERISRMEVFSPLNLRFR